ncbi:rhodanese domain-containing protein CG4456-like [Homalodisca vitripennis]|uniref:rhodanese domain-containing protein CG4456-like n=1 Tax=Homalodisca vitripennis TaxID=197043 RepID=UPI001EEAF229|nr:rhodanese domain-containing protein CG4456-like [Homalodisca vitripennis]KAG8299751.1 Thiosulfate sulfurtransferase/rhodanese-like domain-containing protein 3 [Homalodisca vitripennis]KAG8309922.1 Thiosulfate sulfurtransferase/rhodanese-like domain-containing protein 3 [Homalodisca vitripennis]
MYRLRAFLTNRALFWENPTLKRCSRNYCPPKITVQHKLDPKIAGEKWCSFTVPSRGIHSTGRTNREINVEEFKTLKKSGMTVIDVRDTKEIKATGTIPGSLNIPLQQINSALGKSAEEFKAAYGKSKPGESQQVLFLCQRGVRSKTAMERAAKLGFKNALSLQGGWEMYSKSTKG